MDGVGNGRYGWGVGDMGGGGEYGIFFWNGGKVQKWREGKIPFTKNVKISLVNVFLQ